MELFGGGETPEKRVPVSLTLKTKSFYKNAPKHNLFKPRPAPQISPKSIRAMNHISQVMQSTHVAEDTDSDSIMDQENRVPVAFQKATTSAPPVLFSQSIAQSGTGPVVAHSKPKVPTYSPPVPQVRSSGNIISAPQFAGTTQRSLSPVPRLSPARRVSPVPPSISPGPPGPDFIPAKNNSVTEEVPAVMKEAANSAVHPFFQNKMFSKPQATVSKLEPSVLPMRRSRSPVPDSDEPERIRRFSGLKQDPASLTKRVTVLDVGQKQFGGKICRECGMCFNRSIVGDRDAHRIYHLKATSATKFPKTIPFSSNSAIESVEDYFTVNSQMIQVKASIEPRGEFYKNFVALRKFIDEELGSNVQAHTMQTGQRAYIYLSQDHVACGFLLAGVVMNTDENNIRRIQSGTGTKHQDWFLGVQVLWVHKPFRRRGIARELLDATRSTFFQHSIPINQVAFSDTTEDGNQFAASYCETADYNVYRFRSV